MIRRSTDSEEVALARELQDRGVSFDEVEFERMRVNALGLSIHQSVDVPSTVWDFPSLYIIGAVIRNDSSQSLSPSGIRFDGPAWQSGIGLMKNVADRRKRLDGFPGDRLDGGIPFGYGLILNYVITLKHITIPPGEFVKGAWLAVGQTPLPLEYHHGDLLRVDLTLFDQGGRHDRKPFWLTVERLPEETKRIERLEGSLG